MDQILDLIRKRRSVRAYNNKPVSKNALDSILEAAKYAPTAGNLQELKYKVIMNKDLIRKISERITAIVKQEYPSVMMRERSNLFYDAPLLIIITGPKENSWIYSDAALAAQNIMLYATSIGLRTCFIGMARFIEEDKKLLRASHIDRQQDCRRRHLRAP